MSLRTALATALTIGLLSPIALAQSPAPQGSPNQSGRAPGIHTRLQFQQKRIRAGQERGTITEVERRRLMAMEQRIRTLTQQFRTSDGKLTGRERLQLQRGLNRVSRAIRRAGRG